MNYYTLRYNRCDVLSVSVYMAESLIYQLVILMQAIT